MPVPRLGHPKTKIPKQIKNRQLWWEEERDENFRLLSCFRWKLFIVLVIAIVIASFSRAVVTLQISNIFFSTILDATSIRRKSIHRMLRLIHTRRCGLRIPQWTVALPCRDRKIPISASPQSTVESALEWTSLLFTLLLSITDKEIN